MIRQRFDRLGLWYLAGHSLVVVMLMLIDATNEAETGSSGFALIPVFMIDAPVLPLILPFVLLSGRIAGSTNRIFLAVLFLILGGMQWYFMGWARSKNLSMFQLIKKFLGRASQESKPKF